MLSKNEVWSLTGKMESEFIERTVSTTNTDKFGEAICAFSNDLSNRKEPGYLLVGVNLVSLSLRLRKRRYFNC